MRSARHSAILRGGLVVLPEQLLQVVDARVHVLSGMYYYNKI